MNPNEDSTSTSVSCDCEYICSFYEDRKGEDMSNIFSLEIINPRDYEVDIQSEIDRYEYYDNGDETPVYNDFLFVKPQQKELFIKPTPSAIIIQNFWKEEEFQKKYDLKYPQHLIDAELSGSKIYGNYYCDSP